MTTERIELIGCQSPSDISHRSVYKVGDIHKQIIDTDNVAKVDKILREGMEIPYGQEVYWSYPHKLKQVLSESFDGIHTSIVAELYDWVTLATKAGVDIIAVKLVGR